MKKEDQEAAVPIIALVGKHIIGEYGIEKEKMSALLAMTELSKRDDKRCKYEEILSMSA